MDFFVVVDCVEVGEAHSYLRSPGHMPRAMKGEALRKGCESS